jgi:AcrR family transcriptional regulator
MTRDGTPTRERLLDAAQHLFARHGVDAVPIREINALAGQRNASALHYHFGSRQGLLVAIVERHQPAIDAERAVLLDRVGRGGPGGPGQRDGDDPHDPHELLATILGPLTDRLRTADGRDYLRIVPQLLGPGHAEDDLPRPPALVDGLDRLEAHLATLPRRLRSERLRGMLLATTTLLADRAVRIEGDGPVPVGHEAFVGELVAMATGLVLAPARVAVARSG